MQVKDEYPWLPESLKNCVSIIKETKYYIYFINPKRPNKPGAEWQFADNIFLENTKYGDVVLDVLKDNRIGGVELYSKLMKEST